MYRFRDTTFFLYSSNFIFKRIKNFKTKIIFKVYLFYSLLEVKRRMLVFGMFNEDIAFIGILHEREKRWGGDYI